MKEKLEDVAKSTPELRGKFTKKQLEQIRNGDLPEGCVWHHAEDPRGRMELVDSIQHMWKHVGGRVIWGGGTKAKGGYGY